MVSPDEVKDRVGQAINMLRTRDGFLLEHRAHERSITHKLAEYLQSEFPDYNVDCEYNLHGSLPKRLLRECEGNDQELVYPDIVVHQRGNDNSNLLVVEAKPRRQSNVPECDRIKLEEFTKLDGNYRYQLGLFIGFDGLNEPQLVWFTGGEPRRPSR
jgi:hypothetical protein